MRVLAFVGPSGTGKSYRAQLVARENNIHYIIDDGLLINENEVLAGTSAKKAPTKIETVKKALFLKQKQKDEIRKAIEKYKLIKDGDRIVMIEDVTTSGKSMEETVPKVRSAADVEIVGLMVSLNRMEVGKGGEKSALDEIQEEYGFKANAIVSMADVVEYLYNKECNGKVVIDDTIKTAIDEYYKQYGAK